MKFQPWVTAYNLLNKRLSKIYPKFQEIHIQLKKGGIAIAYKAYIAFMVLTSIIALIVGFILSLILLLIPPYLSLGDSTSFSNEFLG